MAFESRRGQNEEKWKKKKRFAILLLFFGWSLGFAFQIWLVKLEKVLLWHFRSLKMKKNWERSVKVIGDERGLPYMGLDGK